MSAARHLQAVPDAEVIHRASDGVPASASVTTPPCGCHGQNGSATTLRLISIRELAEILGVSEFTVRKWCAKGPEAGLVPLMIRVNGQIRFRPRDVEDYLYAREVR